MTDLTRLCVTATAETALKKLKKAEIGVYRCEKRGAYFIFSVKDNQLKKVFAIFSKPCYNIRVTGMSRRGRGIKTLITRAGLFVGAFLFVAIAAISNSFLLKITVSGSGSYLSPEVRRIVYECGAAEYRPFKNFDAPAATGKILALPRVTFCNIEKHGSVLVVDVQVDDELGANVLRTPLVSDCAGEVKNIVAVCGTACVSVGDTVHKGDTLIAAYTVADGKEAESLAVGYAEIQCSASYDFFAETESEESLKEAYASALLTEEQILTRSHTVEATDGGVVYVIEITYLHKLSINIS